MNFNCSEELKQLHAHYVNELWAQKKYVSATVGCEYGTVRACDKSGNYVGVHYNATLLYSMRTKLGGIVGDKRGTNVKGNPLTIGVCAEQHAANEVLNSLCSNCTSAFEVEKLVFTKAMRPKGKKIIPPCLNCQTLFT